MAQGVTYIPVIVTDKTDSIYPVKQDGIMVVDSRMVGQPSGTVMHYDFATDAYKDVDFANATTDYIVKLSTYQNQYKQIQADKAALAAQKETWAVAGNASQVNSLADVLTAGNAQYNPIKNSVKALGQFMTWDWDGAAKTWWDGSVFNWLGDKANAGIKLINNTVIKPLRADEPTITKVQHLGLNALINVGETIDLVTGANTVKGFVQGLGDGGLKQGIENVGRGFGLVDETRTQYDWDTGNILADIALEVVSDPTNYLTFGGSFAISKLGKSKLSDIIVKSADEVGVPITRISADTASSRILRTFKLGKGSLEDSIIDSTLTPIMKNLDVANKQKLYSTVLKNVQAVKETKSFNLLNTIAGSMRSSDEIQKRFTQAALVTSPAAVGYVPVRLLKHYAPQAASYLTYTMNKTNKHIDAMKQTPTTQIADEFALLRKHFDSMKSVIKGAEASTLIDEMYQNITRHVQLEKYNSLAEILSNLGDTRKTLNAADSWAQREGFGSLLEYRNALRSVPNIIPADLKAMATDLDGMIRALYTKEYAGTFKRLNTVLSAPVTPQSTMEQVTSISNVLFATNNIVPYPNEVLLKQITDVRDLLSPLAVQQPLNYEALNNAMRRLRTGLDNELVKLTSMVDDTSHLRVMNDARMAKLISNTTETHTAIIDRMKDMATVQGVDMKDFMIQLNPTGRVDIPNQFTPKQLASDLYTFKLSEAESLKRILNTEDINNAYNIIRNNSTIRTVLRLMASDELFQLDDTLRPAVNKLLEDASSFYVGEKLMNNILTDNVFSDTFKDALMDVLSGMPQLGYHSIRYDFTTNTLAKVRKHLDSVNNAHPTMLRELVGGSNTKAAVDSLAYRLEHTDVYPQYQGVVDLLTNDDVYSNVYYNIGHTGYQHGGLHEITFRPIGGDPITIVNKDFDPDMLDAETVRKLYGTSKQEYLRAYKVIQDQRANDPSVILAGQDTFVYQVYEQMQKLTGEAKTNEKSLRLVGFNSASESLGSDFVLNQFFKKNNLNVNILYDGIPGTQGIRDVYTFDVAQHYRILNHNAVAIPNEYYDRLDTIFSNMGNYLDAANKSLDFTGEANVKLLPNINIKTLEALENVTSLLASYANGTAPYGDDVFDTFLKGTDLQPIQQTHTVLTNLLYSLGETLKGIGETNDKLGAYAVMQSELRNATGDPNIMSVIRKLYTEDGVLPVATKKLFDANVFAEWFPNVSATNHTIVTKFASKAKELQQQLARITQPQILLELTPTEVQQVVHTLRGIVDSRGLAKGMYMTEVYLNLGGGKSNLHSYVIAQDMYSLLASSVDEDELLNIRAMLRGHSDTFTTLLEFPNETILSKQSAYTPNIPVLRSKNIQPDAVLMRAAKEQENVRAITQKAKTLIEFVSTENVLRDLTNTYTSAEQVQKQMLMPFYDLNNTVQQALDEVSIDADTILKHSNTQLAKFTSRKEYTQAVNKVLESVDALGTQHAKNAATQIFNMDADTYAKFLFKKSAGVQVIRMNSEIFREESTAMSMKRFTDMLQGATAEAQHIKYYINEATHDLVVWLDTTELDLDSMVEATKDFVYRADYAVVNRFGDKYNQYMQAMTNAVDPSYALSSHNVLTAERHSELLAYLPEHVQASVLSHDYLIQNSMFDGLYNYTLVGDYGTGVGDIYTTHSTSILTNISSGFNATYKKFNSIDSYRMLLFNPMNSLKSWLDDASKLTTVDLHEVSKVLDDGNMVVAGLFNGKAVKLDVSTPKAIQRAVELGAVLLDYSTFNKAVEVINEHTISNPVVQWLNRHFLAPLKVGQLLTTGWVMRNIPDSVSKGLIQAGDTGYLTSFIETLRIKKMYDNTLTHLYADTAGMLNKTALHEFFVKNADNNTFLSEDLFERILAFTKSSSANPTAKQLELVSNTVDKIYRNMSNEPMVTKDMVRRMLEIYDKTDTVEEAMQQILAEVGDNNITYKFASQLKFLPSYKKTRFEKFIQDDFLPSKAILTTNNGVETTVRLHTFLYHNEYKGSSFAEAIRMVDESQFNRARDTVGQRWLETLMPFSSFAIDNLRFWADVVGRGNNVLAMLEDVASGAYDEDEFDLEEMMRNQSLGWTLSQGNLILNENGLTYKASDSMHSALEFFVNPIETLADMWHVAPKALMSLVAAINADEEAYLADPYNNTKPISMYTTEDYADEWLPLIPVMGVLYQRYSTAYKKYKIQDDFLPLLMPSMFTITKLDRTGTTYQGRPVGYDWYNQTQEYRDTHRYVFGVSYIPKWLTKDATKYVDTYGRLKAMGYDEEEIGRLLDDGWYFDKKTYELKQYVEGEYPAYTRKSYTQRTYPKRVYAKRSYAKRSYPKNYRVKRKRLLKNYVRRSYMKPSYYNNYVINPRVTSKRMYPSAYRNTKYFGLRNLYKDNYAKYGARRMLMSQYAGETQSATKLMRQMAQQKKKQSYRRF